jgi:hypothetical protein
MTTTFKRDFICKTLFYIFIRHAQYILPDFPAYIDNSFDEKIFIPTAAGDI